MAQLVLGRDQFHDKRIEFFANIMGVSLPLARGIVFSLWWERVHLEDQAEMSPTYIEAVTGHVCHESLLKAQIIFHGEGDCFQVPPPGPAKKPAKKKPDLDPLVDFIDRAHQQVAGNPTELLVTPETARAMQASALLTGSPLPPPLGAQTAQLIQTYIDAYRLRYGEKTKPDIGGAVRGQMLRLIKDVGIARAKNLVQVYLQMDDKWFVTKCHDFLTLMGNVTKVSAALDTGQTPGAGISWQGVNLKEAA